MERERQRLQGGGQPRRLLQSKRNVGQLRRSKKLEKLSKTLIAAKELTDSYKGAITYSLSTNFNEVTTAEKLANLEYYVKLPTRTGRNARG